MSESRRVSQNEYLEYVEPEFVPSEHDFLITSHTPRKFRAAYHHHASVEINYLIGCDLVYSFSGRIVQVPRDRVTLFWGAIPHSVRDVKDTGRIVNIYISLSRFLSWGIATSFLEQVMSGAVVAGCRITHDRQIFSGWVNEYPRGDPAWQRLLLGEIEMRIRRLALGEYTVLLEGENSYDFDVRNTSSLRYIDRMMHFIADNFVGPLTVSDVARHVGLSPSYAMALFKRTVGVSIKVHVNRIRLSHAQMLLASTDDKIINVAMDSGFSSLSSFYDAFREQTGISPASYRRTARQ